MNLYVVVLFLHIVGAAALFVGLGMEGLILKNFSKVTTTSQAVAVGESMFMLRITFGTSAVLLFLSGIYMVIESWSWNAWVILGIILLSVLSGYGSMTGKKIGIIVTSLDKKEKPLSTEIKSKLSAPLLLQSYKIRFAVAVSLIFIMTLKTGWVGSISAVIVAFAIGYLISKQTKSEVKNYESA
jgi:hypothetical protein